jgi:protein O-GlcNAc transferase
MSFQAEGLIDEAIDCYRKAIMANPDLFAAYNNLDAVLQKKRLFEEASASYQKALLIDPRLAETFYNLGVLFQRQGKHRDALTAYDAAINIKPGYIAARWARCLSRLPIIYSDDSDLEYSRKLYRKELLELSESIRLDSAQDIGAAVGAVGTQQPFHLAYQGLNDCELQQIYGDLVHKIISAGYPPFSIRPVMPSYSSAELLRVGMVSGFFHSHPVWKTITKGWAENLDKTKFHLYGYYTDRTRDSETDRAKLCFDRFVDNIHSFEALCNMIVNDNLHVVIYLEMGMNPVTVRLAALRLAPVQCASWEHPYTSGLPTIDYCLSGDLMEPPDGDDPYTEQLVRLLNLSIYYEPNEFQDVRPNRSLFGLPPGAILYHCCQTLFKFLPKYDAIFPRIAQRVGNCRFIFSSLPGIASIIKQFRTRIYRAFEQFSLNADDYVVFLQHLGSADYMAFNKVCDVFLDPIGWSGCTSTLEAVDCNLPVVAFPGP